MTNKTINSNPLLVVGLDRKVRRQRTEWVIGAFATCTICGKEFENYRTAKRQAAKHALETGHKVTGEITRYFEFGG